MTICVSWWCLFWIMFIWQSRVEPENFIFRGGRAQSKCFVKILQNFTEKCIWKICLRCAWRSFRKMCLLENYSWIKRWHASVTFICTGKKGIRNSNWLAHSYMNRRSWTHKCKHLTVGKSWLMVGKNPKITNFQETRRARFVPMIAVYMVILSDRSCSFPKQLHTSLSKFQQVHSECLKESKASWSDCIWGVGPDTNGSRKFKCRMLITYTTFKRITLIAFFSFLRLKIVLRAGFSDFVFKLLHSANFCLPKRIELYNFQYLLVH